MGPRGGRTWSERPLSAAPQESADPLSCRQSSMFMARRQSYVIMLLRMKVTFSTVKHSKSPPTHACPLTGYCPLPPIRCTSGCAVRVRAPNPIRAEDETRPTVQRAAPSVSAVGNEQVL